MKPSPKRLLPFKLSLGPRSPAPRQALRTPRAQASVEAAAPESSQARLAELVRQIEERNGRAPQQTLRKKIWGWFCPAGHRRGK